MTCVLPAFGGTQSVYGVGMKTWKNRIELAKVKVSSGSYLAFLLAQAQVAFNDNAAKILTIGLAFLVLQARAGADASKDNLDHLVSVFLPLPFIVFASLSGWVADRYPKTLVLNWMLFAQVLVLVLMVAGSFLESLPLMIGGFALLAVQSAFFSPAKQGLISELVEARDLGPAVGYQQFTLMVGILAGAGLGGFLLDYPTKLADGDFWKGSFYGLLPLLLLSLLAWGVFQFVPRRAAAGGKPFSGRLAVQHFRDLRAVMRKPDLRRSALGVAFFWTYGGFLFLELIRIGRMIAESKESAASETSLLLLCVAGGIGLGNVIGGLLNRGKIRLGYVPISAFAQALVLLSLSRVPLEGASFKLLIAFLGVLGGIFLVPIYASFIRQTSKGEEGRDFAVGNLLDNCGGLAAIGLNALVVFWNLEVAEVFGVTALVMAAVGFYALRILPQNVALTLISWVFRLLFQFRTKGFEKIPREGGVLIVANHLSYFDAPIIALLCPRPVRFIGARAMTRFWPVRIVYRLFKVIEVDESSALDTVRKSVSALREGEAVLLFPEGGISRDGFLQSFKGGWELIAKKAQVPVVPIKLDNVFGAYSSFGRSHPFFSMPSLRRPIELEVLDVTAEQVFERKTLEQSYRQPLAVWL